MERQRLGINLVSLMTALWGEGRLSIRTIQWYLKTMYGWKLSTGGIVGAIHGGGAAGGTSSGQGAGPHASPVVHADETGWRQNVENGYVWTYSTPTGRC